MTTESQDESDLALAVELLDLLRDPDECWFDHGGGCQAHGFLSLEPDEACPNEQARRLVARHSPTTPPGHPQSSCDCKTCAAGDDQWCCRRCHDLAKGDDRD